MKIPPNSFRLLWHFFKKHILICKLYRNECVESKLPLNEIADIDKQKIAIAKIETRRLCESRPGSQHLPKHGLSSLSEISTIWCCRLKHSGRHRWRPWYAKVGKDWRFWIALLRHRLSTKRRMCDKRHLYVTFPCSAGNFKVNTWLTGNKTRRKWELLPRKLLNGLIATL